MVNFDVIYILAVIANRFSVPKLTDVGRDRMRAIQRRKRPSQFFSRFAEKMFGERVRVAVVCKRFVREPVRIDIEAIFDERSETEIKIFLRRKQLRSEEHTS